MKMRIAVIVEIDEDEKQLLEDLGIVNETGEGDFQEVRATLAKLFEAEVDRIKADAAALRRRRIAARE